MYSHLELLALEQNKFGQLFTNFGTSYSNSFCLAK
jgi:hypothetical protein